MQQQVWRELFTRAASAAVAARVNNSRHIVSGIWLRYFFKDHNSSLHGHKSFDAAYRENQAKRPVCATLS